MTETNWMEIERFLAALRADGFSVRRADGKLLVAPASKLSADQRSVLAAQRPALIDWLAWEEAAPAPPSRGLLRAWFWLIEHPPVVSKQFQKNPPIGLDNR